MEGEMLMASNLRVVEPNNIFRKVPIRRPNADMRSREYLTPAEVEKLIAAAKLGRHGHRDATLILVAFRHGLRAVTGDVEGDTLNTATDMPPAISDQNQFVSGLSATERAALRATPRRFRYRCWRLPTSHRQSH
jgi:hypothetical protein